MTDHMREINTPDSVLTSRDASGFQCQLSESENKSMTSQSIRTYLIFKLNVKCSLQPIILALCNTCSLMHLQLKLDI